MMAARRKPLREVLAGGDLRASLEAIRGRLAEELQNTEGAAAAAVSRELRIVLEKLEAIPGGREVSKLDELESAVADELAPRRATRQPDAANS